MASKYFRKLTARNTFLTLAFFALPFLLLLVVVDLQISGVIKNQVNTQLAGAVQNNLKTIKLFLDDRMTDLGSVARLSCQDLGCLGEQEKIFLNLIRGKQWYDFIFIADLRGDLVRSYNRELQGNISDRDYFQACAGGQPFISDIFYSDITETNVMVISHPVLNLEGRVIGVIGASLNLNYLYGLISDLRLGRTSELFLLSREGLILSPTKLGAFPFAEKAFSGDFNPHRGESGVIVHQDYRGERVLCAYQLLPGTSIYLASEMDLQEALLPVRRFNRIILYFFLPSFLFLIIISNLYSRRVTGLVQKLTANLARALDECRERRQQLDKINRELENRILESQHLAAELQLSEQYILHLIDSISLGLAGTDLEGRLAQFNRHFLTLFETREIRKGEILFEAVPALKDPEIMESFRATVNEASARQMTARKIDRGHGEEYFNLAFFPIINGGRRLLGITILVENVTEKEKLRNKLAEYEKLSALSQLALGAAHEINNPLLGISSFLEIQMEETTDTQKKQQMEVVLENVYRISQTIRGLLDFARPAPPRFTRVNLNQVVMDTLTFLSHQPIFKKIQTEQKLYPQLPPVTADLNQIRQVLTNIFINAAQAMPGGGRLTVTTSKVKFEDFVQVEISDTGDGISPEDQKKIFDPFYTTKKSQGTGLGLSISLSYIKSHNGDIRVQSQPGAGTTVTIILPIRQKGRPTEKEEEVIS
ncbi:MAG: ATP-binding protein [Candidatus Saccharicenans sp.]|nr:ATP-binding protein [Candidatus Saccharicenans sp.]MDI6849343.1 ATP-binding protein [Candidatus Saccharicenans sp.]